MEEILQMLYGTHPTCCKCGMCCKSYALSIPDPLNKNDTILKEDGTMCMYCTEKGEHTKICSLYSEKYRPEICDDFGVMGEYFMCALFIGINKVTIVEQKYAKSHLDFVHKSNNPDHIALIGSDAQYGDCAYELYIDNVLCAIAIYSSKRRDLKSLNTFGCNYATSADDRQDILSFVFVTPEHRGRNFGYALTKFAVLQHKEEWFKKIFVEVISEFASHIITQLNSEFGCFDVFDASL